MGVQKADLSELSRFEGVEALKALGLWASVQILGFCDVEVAKTFKDRFETALRGVDDKLKTYEEEMKLIDEELRSIPGETANEKLSALSMLPSQVSLQQDSVNSLRRMNQ